MRNHTLERQIVHKEHFTFAILTFLLTAICLDLSQASASQEKVTLQFWAVSGSYQDVDLYNRLARSFESKTGIAVQVTPLGWGNFLTKYMTSMAAGIPPDVGVTNLSGPVDYGRVGGALDLLEAFPEEIEAFQKEFYPNILEGFKFRGRLYGVPAGLTTLCLFYRTDIFQKLGIKPPETWSEMDEAIRALEAAGYHYGFGWTRGDSWALDLFSRPFGISSIDYGPGQEPLANWDQPAFQKSLSYAMKLWNLHDLGDRTLQGTRLVALFRLDDPRHGLPMFVDLTYLYNSVPVIAPELAGKWDILPWPKADQGEAYNIIGGMAYAIFRKSSHHRESFEWLKYLNSLEAQREMIRDNIKRGEDSTFYVSPVRSVWSAENDAFWDSSELEGCRRVRQVTAQAMDSFHLREAIIGGAEAYRYLDSALDRIGSKVFDSLTAMSGNKKISRWELVQSFARGENARENQAINELVDAAVKSEMKAVTPLANQAIAIESRKYAEQYGDILDRLPQLEKQWDVLDVMEAAAAAFLAILAGLVLCLRRLRKRLVSYLFIAPPVVATVLFLAVPAAVALYLSFTEYNPVLPLSSARWIGARHYMDAFTHGPILDSLKKTLFYAAGMLPIQIVISLFLASLLNNPLMGQKYWRFLYFSPMVTSVVSISLIFVALFQGAQYGWVNAFLLKIGLLDDVLVFLDNERTFLWCVILLAIWHGLAFNIIIFLAGLQQIPDALYEAAAVDGAGCIARFRHISLPGLRPQIFFALVVGGIWSFQVFEPIYMLGGGAGEAGSKFGPNDAGRTLVPLIYQTGFEDFHMGEASAIAYIMFVLIFTLTLLQTRAMKRD